MSGDPHYVGYATAFCTCARHKGKCPHCKSTDFASYSVWAWHIDKCHEKALAQGWKPGEQSIGPEEKSIPPIASQ